MAFNGPIEDKLAIHELVMVYGDAVTRKSWSGWRDSNSRPPDPQPCNELKAVNFTPHFTPANKG